MPGSASFCTCTDHDCKLHPVNHDQGCTPCIAKNLKKSEMPSCFFHKVSNDTSDVPEYTIEGFLRWAAGKARKETSP
jgi:hypothetical protein